MYDTHMHVFSRRFGVSPASPQFAEAEEYLAVQERLGITHSVVVQSVLYGFDNGPLLDAIDALGAQRTRGVAIIDPVCSDCTLQQLHDAGVRGARFFMLPGGPLRWEQLGAVAARVGALGWHVQLQLNGRELPARLRDIESALGHVEVVFDHIGRFDPPVRTSEAPLLTLIELLRTGRVWVKLSAPYEASCQGYPFEDVREQVDALVEAAPDRLVWATNWPHPHRPGQDEESLLRLLEIWIPNRVERDRVLTSNARRLYGF